MAAERLLGDWIRRRRAELDLTQELLAEQVGCAVDTIRALENGRRRASREMADRLATMLHIPLRSSRKFVRPDVDSAPVAASVEQRGGMSHLTAKGASSCNTCC